MGMYSHAILKYRDFQAIPKTPKGMWRFTLEDDKGMTHTVLVPNTFMLQKPHFICFLNTGANKVNTQVELTPLSITTA